MHYDPPSSQQVRETRVNVRRLTAGMSIQEQGT